MKKPTYKWNKETIQALLETNPQAVYNGLVQIYRRQTHSEQVNEQTHDRNDIGFSGVDGKILTSFAKFYLSHKYLSPKQFAIAKNKMKKYWRQLMEISINEGKNPIIE
jgi:hypothetical protein